MHLIQLEPGVIVHPEDRDADPAGFGDASERKTAARDCGRLVGTALEGKEPAAGGPIYGDDFFARADLFHHQFVPAGVSNRKRTEKRKEMARNEIR